MIRIVSSIRSPGVRELECQLQYVERKGICFSKIFCQIKVIKLFSGSAQLSMEFFPLINVKTPTIVGVLTFMSGKNSILGLSEPEKKLKFLDILILMSI